jgi:hypothetical protein
VTRNTSRRQPGNAANWAVASPIIERAIGEVWDHYGGAIGPGRAGLWLPGNNARHARETLNSGKDIVQPLVKAGHLPPGDAANVAIASAFHVLEQGSDCRASREGSADRALFEMEKRPDVFDARDMEMVYAMIMGTAVDLQDEALRQAIGQPHRHDPAGGAFEFEQRIVADADRAVLRSQRGLETGLRFVAEGEYRAGVDLPDGGIEALRLADFDAERVAAGMKQQATICAEPFQLDHMRDTLAATQEKNVEAWAELSVRFERAVDGDTPAGAAFVGVFRDARVYKESGILPPADPSPPEPPPPDDPRGPDGGWPSPAPEPGPPAVEAKQPPHERIVLSRPEPEPREQTASDRPEPSRREVDGPTGDREAPPPPEPEERLVTSSGPERPKPPKPEAPEPPGFDL